MPEMIYGGVMSASNNRLNDIWVFVGDTGQLPSGVFTALATAESAIKRYALSGLLTAYPLDLLVYEWAIENGFFRPKDDAHRLPIFIEGFTSPSLEHYHYLNGDRTS
jgi:hypothetical protein